MLKELEKLNYVSLVKLNENIRSGPMGDVKNVFSLKFQGKMLSVEIKQTLTQAGTHILCDISVRYVHFIGEC